MSRATDDVASAAQLACLLEASAAKPGNVSPGRHFRDVRYEDFLASAAAVGPPLSRAGERSLGATVREGIEATSRWARSNTNLGIVLLLAPLARAGLLAEPGPGPRDALRASLERVLAGTTIADARDVYAAIRRADPGGLGRSAEQDVARDPTVTLLDAMRLAESRDGVAREYVSAFRATFEVGAPALDRARYDGLGWDDAIVETYLTLLAAAPDTHVARRAGVERAVAISRHAAAALDAGGVRSEGGRAAVGALDGELRDPDNSGNPGTTADLTAASIFVVLLGGGWQFTHGSLDAATR